MDSHLRCMLNHPCSTAQAPTTERERNARFLAMLPRIRRQAAYYLRHVSRKDQADAIQEVVANAFVSYVRLNDRGKSDLAVASPLSRYAARQYLSGRRVGNHMNGHDVTSDYCRQKNGVSVERLDFFDKRSGDWEELVVEDRHSNPAEVASVRVDFREWLTTLPERTRHVAETLATGEATSHVARTFGLTPSRISQLRRELHQAWRVFQGELAPAAVSALA